MRRDYIETMQAVGYGEFLTACESLKNCKYVIAESKITALLKSIADNKQLYMLFGKVLYGFDYSAVFSECVYNGLFALPDDPKTAVALVFRILLDIDSGKMSLRSFLEAYFYSVSINESYARFCLEVVSPFESYCRTLLAGAETDEKSDVEPEVDDDDAKNNKCEMLKNDALACIATLLQIADSVISGVIDRAEFTACLGGLTRAIESDDFKNAIPAFLGVKYAIAYFFKSSKNVLDIFKRLEFDIKHLTD